MGKAPRRTESKRKERKVKTICTESTIDGREIANSREMYRNHRQSIERRRKKEKRKSSKWKVNK